MSAANGDAAAVPPDFASSVAEGAATLGLTLDSGQLERLEIFARLLLEHNRHVNLTRVAPSKLATELFLDSLSITRAVDASRVGRAIDVGTGGGFPGMPLAIAWPKVAMTLLDATRKKLAFLEGVVRELGLEHVVTHHARAEDAGRDRRFRERFDLVTAKAVARLDVLAEYVLPLTRVGGCAVAFKSAAVDQELAAAESRIRELGGAPRVVRLTLPGTSIERALVVLEKARPTQRRGRAGRSRR